MVCHDFRQMRFDEFIRLLGYALRLNLSKSCGVKRILLEKVPAFDHAITTCGEDLAIGELSPFSFQLRALSCLIGLRQRLGLDG